MKKTVLIYGAALALLTLLLRALEYRYYVRELTTEIYISLVAVFFTALGVWVGMKLFLRPRESQTVNVRMEELALDPEKLKALGITGRELDVLQLMAGGLSNQEIADKLFVSLHTVKTHCSNIYSKLNVKRRTQAVQRAVEISTEA